MKKILFILLFITTAFILSAQTNYYVKTYVSGGRDEAGKDGLSEGNAWATLSYACGRVGTGNNIINVASGNYTDNYRAIVAVGVDILGNSTTPPNITTSYAAPNEDYGYLYIASAAGNAVNGSNTISYININGNNLAAPRAGYVGFRSYVKIHHCEFTNFLYSGIRFEGTTAGYTTTPTNTLPVGNEVYNCLFSNLSQRSGSGTGGHLRMEGMNGMKVYSNTFTQTQRSLGYNGNIMAGFQNEACEITGNIFYKNNTEYTTSLPSVDTWNFFSEFHYTRGGWILADNEFNGAACWDQSGVVKGNYDFGIKIYGNTFQTNTPPPYNPHKEPYLDLETFSYANDIYVYENYFKYTRRGILLNNVYTSSNNVWIYSNIFEDVSMSDNLYSYAIEIGSDWDGTRGVPFSNINIFNNTIDAGSSAYAGIGTNLAGDITNFNIRNNIINGNFSYPIRFEARSGFTPTLTNLNLNNNMIYGGVTTITYVPGVTYVPAANQTGNFLNYNPSFVGGSPYDFNLSSVSSPAYHAGMEVGVDIDYAGNFFHEPPSIGALELYTGTALPTVTTGSIYNVEATTATCGGDITDDGGSPIIAKGVCWSLYSNPTIGDDFTSNGTGTGSFAASLTGLTASTTYHVRAYATNSTGTSYGNDLAFVTDPTGVQQLGPFIKLLDRYIKFEVKFIKVD